MIPWTECQGLRLETHNVMQQAMYPPSDGNWRPQNLLGWAFLETVTLCHWAFNLRKSTVSKISVMI
jgi:hypothetical protein